MKLSSTGLVLTLLDKFGSVTPIMATPAISLTEAQATIKALVMAGRLVESRQDGKVVYTLNK
jgi:predicted transcriptional regulator